MQKLLRSAAFMAACAVASITLAGQQPEYRVALRAFQTEPEARSVIAALEKRGRAEAGIAAWEGELQEWMTLEDISKPYARQLLLLGKGENAGDPISDPESGHFVVLLVVDKRGPDDTRRRLQRELNEDLKALLPGFSKLPPADKADFLRYMESALTHPRAHVESRCGSGALAGVSDGDLSSDDKVRAAMAQLETARSCLEEFQEYVRLLPDSYLRAADRKRLPGDRVKAIDEAWNGLKSERIDQASRLQARVEREAGKVSSVADQQHRIALDKKIVAQDKAMQADEALRRSREADFRQFERCVVSASRLESQEKEARRHVQQAERGVVEYEASARRLAREFNSSNSVFRRDCVRSFNLDPEAARRSCSHPAYGSKFCDGFR